MNQKEPKIDVDLIQPPSSDWIVDRYAMYLKGKRYTVYTHGTAVVWGETEVRSSAESHTRMCDVAKGRPDFKVRRHADGTYLVTFRGGVAGLVSSSFLTANFAKLSAWADTSGRFVSESFLVDRTDGDAVSDLVAGLYARANLLQDARELNVLE